MLTTEQIVAAQKANLATFIDLTGKAFAGVEKLTDLNLQVAKNALGEAASTTQAALSAKDLQELFALQAATLQPIPERAAAYGRKVYDIAATAGAEVSKLVESTATDAQQKFMTVVDTAVKNAPVGTDKALAIVKSAVSAANDAYESLQKAAQQASGVAQANLSSAFTASATKATSAGKSKRAA